MVSQESAYIAYMFTTIIVSRLVEIRKTMDSKALDLTSASINFIIDVVVLILPQKVIWGLQMSFSKRLGVSTVFMFGFL